MGNAVGHYTWGITRGGLPRVVPYAAEESTDASHRFHRQRSI
jgi:hypothetical protein